MISSTANTNTQLQRKYRIMLKIKTYIDTILSWNNMHFQWPHFINLFFCCCWYFEFIFVECWHEKPFHAIQKLARYSIHYFYCCCPSAELYPINKINWKLPNRLTIKMAKFNSIYPVVLMTMNNMFRKIWYRESNQSINQYTASKSNRTCRTTQSSNIHIPWIYAMIEGMSHERSQLHENTDQHQNIASRKIRKAMKIKKEETWKNEYSNMRHFSLLLLLFLFTFLAYSPELFQNTFSIERMTEWRKREQKKKNVVRFVYSWMMHSNCVLWS